MHSTRPDRPGRSRDRRGAGTVVSRSPHVAGSGLLCRYRVARVHSTFYVALNFLDQSVCRVQLRRFDTVRVDVAQCVGQVEKCLV